MGRGHTVWGGVAQGQVLETECGAGAGHTRPETYTELYFPTPLPIFNVFIFRHHHHHIITFISLFSSCSTLFSRFLPSLSTPLLQPVPPPAWL